MKRTRSLQKFAAQFGYEHKNRSNPFSGIKKHANELSKLLDSMFPKDKNDKEKSLKGSQTNEKFSDRSEKERNGRAQTSGRAGKTKA